MRGKQRGYIWRCSYKGAYFRGGILTKQAGGWVHLVRSTIARAQATRMVVAGAEAAVRG